MLSRLLCCGVWTLLARGLAGERHGLMIDAGSEASRLVIFRWNSLEEAWPPDRLIEPTPIFNASCVPGIGTFALSPAGAGASLKPLIDYAQHELAHLADVWHEMPLWLRATAGMRLLHAAEREAVINDVRAFLRSSGFGFRDATVITGEEEGIYGWIAVNYNTGAFNHSEPDITKTLGSLDLGGASTQIVFIPKHSIMQHAFNLRMGRLALRVYSYSFLHFGQREAAHRTADLIISAALEKVQSVDELHHPCYATGYVYMPRFEYSDNRSFPIRVAMQGTSDFLMCLKLVEKIFRKGAHCLVQDCSFYGVYQPHVWDRKFVAFSHFWDVANDLALPKNAKLKDLMIASEYVCALSLEQLNAIFVRVKSEYDRLHLCFHSVYIYALLTYGFGFAPDSGQVTFSGNTAHDVPIDYVDGAMLYEINQDPFLARRSSHVAKSARRPTSRPKPHEEQVVLHS